jgi:RimJ/RimL family protein N-acetyltransferase
MPAPAELTDGRILLRAHRPGDCQAMHEAVIESLREISPWLPWCHPAYSPEDTASFIRLAAEAWAQNTHYQFAVIDVIGQTFLGGIAINHIARTNRLGNVGYWIRTSRTRQGIATAAVRLIAQFAFGALGLTRLEIACIPTNLASRSVALRSGARLEGIARNRLVMHGIPYDAALYGLVPQDLQDSASTGGR